VTEIVKVETKWWNDACNLQDELNRKDSEQDKAGEMKQDADSRGGLGNACRTNGY